MKCAEDRRNRLFDVVGNVLREHEVQSLLENEELKCFKYTVDKDNKHLDVDVRAWVDRIEVMCLYPFKVQSNAIALISMYMAMNNYDAMTYTLKLNQFNGRLFVETSIPVCEDVVVDKVSIWREINNAIEFALDHFYRLANYSVGKLPADERDKYTWLLLSSFDALNGDEIDFLNIHYGTEDFQEDFFWKMKTIQSFEKWVEKTKKWYDDNFPFC